MAEVIEWPHAPTRGVLKKTKHDSLYGLSVHVS